MARAKSYRRVCPECSASFMGGPDALFCSTAHKTAWHNRAGGRGRNAVPLMQAWRGGRGRKGDEMASWAYGELCALADLYNEEDRRAGRIPAAEYLRPRKALGWKAVDLAA